MLEWSATRPASSSVPERSLSRIRDRRGPGGSPPDPRGTARRASPTPSAGKSCRRSDRHGAARAARGRGPPSHAPVRPGGPGQDDARAPGRGQTRRGLPGAERQAPSRARPSSWASWPTCAPARSSLSTRSGAPGLRAKEFLPAALEDRHVDVPLMLPGRLPDPRRSGEEGGWLLSPEPRALEVRGGAHLRGLRHDRPPSSMR